MKITKLQTLISYFILTLSCSVMISCDSPKDQCNQVFMPNKSLGLEADTKIDLESLGILAPDHIRCMDSTIIIFDNVPTECLKVISAETNTLIASFLNTGKASYEVTDVANIDCYSGQNGLCVNVMELNGKHNKSYLLSQPSALYSTCRYDKNLQSAVTLNNKLAVAASIFDSVKFYLFENNGQVIDSLQLFPPMPDNVNNILTHSIACSGNMRKNPQGTLIVSNVIYDGGIDVIEVQNSEKLKHKWSFRTFPMTYNTIETNGYLMPTPSKESKSGYLDTAISSKYIYALYSGEYMNSANSTSSDMLHVFDYDGIHISSIKLNKKVFSIAVDSNDNDLYCLGDGDDTNYLYKFKLENSFDFVQ